MTVTLGSRVADHPAQWTHSDGRIPLTQFPPRPVATHWPATELDRSGVVQLVSPSLRGVEGSKTRAVCRRGLVRMLDFLEDQPGRTWQERWLASGADAAGDDWAMRPAEWLERHGIDSRARLELMTASFLVLVGADVIRPSLRWLLTGGKKRKVTRNMVTARDRHGFEELRLHCQRDPGISAQAEKHAVFRAAVIIAAKGGIIADITIGDFLEVIELEEELRGRAGSGSVGFRVLREMGVFGPDLPTLREIRSIGQRTVEELVDRYPISCRPVRDLIVD